MYNIIQLNDKDLSELQSIAKESGITKKTSLKRDHVSVLKKKVTRYILPPKIKHKS